MEQGRGRKVLPVEGLAAVRQNHHRELQSLGFMDAHHGDGVFPGGHHRALFQVCTGFHQPVDEPQEGGEPGIAPLLIPGGILRQQPQVLQPLTAVLHRAYHRLEAGAVVEFGDEPAHRKPGRAEPEVLHQPEELRRFFTLLSVQHQAGIQ